MISAENLGGLPWRWEGDYGGGCWALLVLEDHSVAFHRSVPPHYYDRSRMNRPPTSSPRVLIRTPRLADEAEVLSLRHRSRAFLERWEPNPPPGRDLFSTEGFSLWVEHANTDIRRRFLVCRAADGVAMGQVSLSEIIRGPLQQAFLGYWIAEEFSGQGYMTEALVLALRVAFQGLRLHRVEANIQPQNTPSIALVKQVGFRKEGFSPQYLEIRGAWADHERWAILSGEFFGKHGPGEG